MSEQNQWFIELYREHSSRLFKQAYYVLRDRHLAEDLVEEAFLILLYKQKDLLRMGLVPALVISVANIIWCGLFFPPY